jgi:carboxyl-terminal processing protease
MRLKTALTSAAAVAGLLLAAQPASLTAADTTPLGAQAPAAGGGMTIPVFTTIMDEVRANYVKPVTDDQLLEGAAKGMLSALDPHSGYLDAKEYRDMMITTTGEFGGLGMEVTMEDGAVKVISPIDDTPAAAAGIKPADLIVAIDGQAVSEMSLSEAVEKLRGPVGTTVKLTMRRQGMDPFQLSLTRAEIKVEPVKARLVDNDIAYIRVTTFSELTAGALERGMDAVKKQANGKLVGVVLDLRNNPGGLLDQAVAVANDFLDGGGIVSIKGRQARDDHTYTAEPGHDIAKGLPIVVLINGGSASASEIVAGALHDDHRAVLLGTRSFGKGSVQTLLPVRESGGAIRLTTALYYTPSGRSIQGEGIAPDVEVQPAKIETVAAGPQEREANLRGALKNEQAQAGAGNATPAPGAGGKSNTGPATATPAASAPKVPPGATPALPPASVALDSNTLGTDQDYQFVRAVDLLKGVRLFNRLAAQ